MPWGSLCTASWGTPLATLFQSIKAHIYAIHLFKTQNLFLSDHQPAYVKLPMIY